MLLVSFIGKTSAEVIFLKVFAESCNMVKIHIIMNLRVLRTIHLLSIACMVSITASLIKVSNQIYLRFFDVDKTLYFLLHFERQRAQKLKQMC